MRRRLGTWIANAFVRVSTNFARMKASALLDVRARWLAQSRTRGRTGPDWTCYLAGGLDGLEQMLDNDGGLDALDPRN